MVNVPGHHVPSANTTETVVRSTHSLQHAVYRFRGVQLQDAANTSDVNAKFQTGGAHQTRQRAVPQFILHLLPGFGRQRPVMYTDLEVGGHALKAGGEGLGFASAVDEEQTRGFRAQQRAKMAVRCVLFRRR